jgi:type I restriction-modification system DNA methylase subunit
MSVERTFQTFLREQKRTSISTSANLSAFIWSVADLLRGDYKQSDYGKVILPFTVLRGLDCVLESTKEADINRDRPATRWTYALQEIYCQLMRHLDKVIA